MDSILISVAQTIVSLIPIFILIYKQGKKDQVVAELTKDIDGLGKKVTECNVKHTAEIEKIKENSRHEVEVQGEKRSKMYADIETTRNAFVEIREAIKYLQRDIESIKADLKEMRDAQ